MRRKRAACEKMCKHTNLMLLERVPSVASVQKDSSSTIRRVGEPEEQGKMRMVLHKARVAGS